MSADHPPPLPERVGVDEAGCYWRDFGEYLSMTPVTDGNTNTPVIAWYVPAIEMDDDGRIHLHERDRYETAGFEDAAQYDAKVARLEAECERLRALAGRNVEQVGPDVHEFCKEEIAELRAVVERLTAEREQRDSDHYEEIRKLQWECVTLRQALADIQSMAGHPDAAQGCRNIIEYARAVLAAASTQETPQ